MDTIQALIKEPLVIVGRILEEEIINHGFNATSVKKTEERVKELYQTHFENNWHQVPCLTNETYKQSKVGKHTLVRMKCMVQDMMDQEMFPGAIRLNEGKYTSALFRDEVLPVQQEAENDAMEDDMSRFVLEDRNVFYCVPIPGETEWARNSFRKSFTSDSFTEQFIAQQGKKRSRSNEDVYHDERNHYQNELSQESANMKRTRSEMQSNASSLADGTSQKYSLDFPLSNETELPCLLKICGQKSDSLKLCDIIEIIGVLAENTSQFASECEKYDEDDLFTVYPPQSLVPRVHCIFFKMYHSVHHPFTDLSKLSILQTIIPDLRSLAVSYISQAFHGDHLTSEYVLLHLFSRIYSRTGSMNLGKFILNITRCPPNNSKFTDNVSRILSSILPACYLLKLTPANLQQLRFGPKKNFATNKLNSGTLQLPCGTLLIIDECKLKQGKIRDQAVLNMQILESLVNQAIIPYDFIYNRMEMPVDLNVCILSEGRSLFKLGVDCIIPMTHMESNAVVNLSAEQMEHIRAFISIVNSINGGFVQLQSSYTINPYVTKMAETEFVEARNSKRIADSEPVTPQTFHRWLSLARLITLSYGKMELTTEFWERMRQMEKERFSRILQYYSTFEK